MSTRPSGVSVAIRLQPLFPGHELAAETILREAASAGAKHVSIEYLKLALEADRSYSADVATVLGGRPIGEFLRLGATRRGREFVLPLGYRVPRLLTLRKLAHSLGMTVGLADNDLLHLSDGRSCCNGIDLHVAGVSVFSGNITGALASSKPGDLIKLDVSGAWTPRRDISPYLNSNARLSKTENVDRDWNQYLSAIWSGSYGVHGPGGYLGIVATGDTDNRGNPTYLRAATVFD